MKTKPIKDEIALEEKHCEEYNKQLAKLDTVTMESWGIKLPLLPSKPTEPIYEKPGFFNKKRVLDQNAERMKTDSWAETWITQSITDETDGSIKVHTVNNIGTNSYDSQVNICDLPCIGGQSYTLTFEIKTSVAMRVAFIQDGGAYTEYAAADISASSDYQTVTLNINAAGIDSNNKLTMEIGLLGSDITFYVRNYNLVQN